MFGITVNSHLRNAIILSLGFFGIFLAFSTVQNLESSLLPGKLGYWSLAATYATFCFSSLIFAAPIANLLGPKWALIVGGLTYLPILLANIFAHWSTLIPSACILGFGAGILWAAQGTYITATGANYATSNGDPIRTAMGLFNGLFFLFFQSTQVVGNIIGSCILMYGGNNEHTARKILFYTFLAVGTGGVSVFLLLGNEKVRNPVPITETTTQIQNISEDEDIEYNSSDDMLVKTEPQPYNILQNLLQVVYLLKDMKMVLLIPMIFFSGMEQSFVFADFTSTVVKKTKGTNWIGFVLAGFGFFDAVGSVVLGKLGDRYGKFVLVIVGNVVHLTMILGYLGLYTFVDDPTKWIEKYYYVVLFGSSSMFGIADACWNTLSPIMMSVFFTDNTEAAFSNMKFWQSLGSAFVFAVGPLMGFRANLLTLLGVLLVADICIVICHFFVASINAVKEAPQKTQ